MFYFFLFIFFNYGGFVNSAAGDSNKILDNSTVIITLQDYNISTPDGESIEMVFTQLPYCVTEIVLTKIPADVHFVVLQAHSYLLSVTLSLDRLTHQNNSIQGTNVGLLKMNRKTDLSFFLTHNTSLEKVDVMVSVQAYSAQAPIPGGCNMELPVEISPFLLTTYNEVTIDVNFAPSAPPLSVLSQSLKIPSNECNLKPSPVRHKMYHRYFPEWDFSKDTYFSILRSMMTKGRILDNGILVPEKLTGLPMKRIFAAYTGTGNAFVVISYVGNHAAVYVPSFSYGCNDLGDDNTCLVLTTTFSKLLCATVLFVGFFICFFGHYFFRIEIFSFGFLASGIISYILVSLLFNNSIALSTAVSVGFVVAALKLVAWAIFGLPVISVTLVTLIFGFLLASVIYYPIIDFIDLLALDINFWGIFIGIVLVCPILMLYFAEKANIVSCAFVGSYIGILSIDHYIGSNLRYVVVNTIRRAVVDNFKLAVIGPPFQWKDFLLCITWAFLTCMGISVQKFLTRNKPPYPPPVNPVKNVFKRWKRPSARVGRPSERSPLLDTTFPNVVPPIYTSPIYNDYDGN